MSPECDSACPPTFSVTASTAGASVALLEVAGELDIATAPLLQEALENQLGSDRSLVQVHVARLTFCDAAGLAVLTQLRGRFAAAGTVMTLVGCGPQLLKILEITGLTGLVALESGAAEGEGNERRRDDARRTAH